MVEVCRADLADDLSHLLWLTGVWGGKIDPKFDCHYFDPTCAAGGSAGMPDLIFTFSSRCWLGLILSQQNNENDDWTVRATSFGVRSRLRFNVYAQHNNCFFCTAK